MLLTNRILKEQIKVEYIVNVSNFISYQIV